MSKGQYFFSVVIPVHNKKNFLEGSVNAVLSQTFQEFEIILVDDASSDGSHEVIAAFSKLPNVRAYKRSEPGPGGYAARNFGVEKSTAKWICFCDADDLWEPTHLEKIKQMIDSYKSIKFATCSFYKEIKAKKIKQKAILRSGLVSRLDSLNALKYSDFMNMNSVAIKKDFFDKLGGFPAGNFRMGGDVYFWFKCILNSAVIGYCDIPTSTWFCTNSEVASNKNNLVGVNPVALLEKEQYHMNSNERHAFNKAVNKRVLAWIFLKAKSGIDFSEDIRWLKRSSMSLFDWLKILRAYFISIKKLPFFSKT